MIVWFPDGWTVRGEGVLAALDQDIETLIGIEGVGCFFSGDRPAIEVNTAIAEDSGLTFDQIAGQIKVAVQKHLVECPTDLEREGVF